mgnify:CR=1 FL=1
MLLVLGRKKKGEISACGNLGLLSSISSWTWCSIYWIIFISLRRRRPSFSIPYLGSQPRLPDDINPIYLHDVTIGIFFPTQITVSCGKKRIQYCKRALKKKKKMLPHRIKEVPSFHVVDLILLLLNLRHMIIDFWLRSSSFDACRRFQTLQLAKQRWRMKGDKRNYNSVI